MGPIQVAVRVHLTDCDVKNWGCDRCGREDKTGGRWDDETKRRKRNCDGLTNESLIVPGVGRVTQCPWSEPEPMIALKWWQEWRFLGLRKHTLFDEEPLFVLEAIKCAEQAYQQVLAEKQKPPKESSE